MSAEFFKGQTKEEEGHRGGRAGLVSAVSTVVAWWTMVPSPEHLTEAGSYQAVTPQTKTTLALSNDHPLLCHDKQG